MDTNKLQLIEDYASGKLDREQIDKVWTMFLEDKTLFDYYEIILLLKQIKRVNPDLLIK